ncbi:unnamed protein product [Withania somnifera]
MPRRSKGRQRVDMVKMKNESNLQVTFSKRRVGAFSKNIFPGKKVYSFGHPNVDLLVDRYLGRNLMPPPNNDGHNQLIVAHRNAGLHELNKELTNIEGILQMEKNCGESLRENRRRANGCWWEAPIEELNLFHLQQLKEALEILKQKVEREAQQQQMVSNNAFPFHTFGSALTPSNGAKPSSSYGLNVGASFSNRASGST